jgi:HPt (histidine-containing phosphotransfer) domain-containing protein
VETQFIIDSSIIQELIDQMGADFVVELIDTYYQETGELIEQLHQALTAGDSITVGRLAHSIKSSSASLGAVNFSQQARELEMLGKAGDLSGADVKLEQLTADFLKVKHSLSEYRNES